jgi:hypothetical protein
VRRPPDVPTLRAAVWALLALPSPSLPQARTMTDVDVAPPPVLPRSAGRGVRAMMRRTAPTCLERALVLQAWGIAQGDARDVVIGVNGTGDRFAAHARLEGGPDGERSVCRELMRVPAQ